MANGAVVAYVMDSRERYGGGGISIRDYDPAWPAMVEQERVRLLCILLHDATDATARRPMPRPQFS